MTNALVLPDLSSPDDTQPDGTLRVAHRPRPASKEKVLCRPWIPHCYIPLCLFWKVEKRETTIWLCIGSVCGMVLIYQRYGT